MKNRIVSTLAVSAASVFTACLVGCEIENNPNWNESNGSGNSAWNDNSSAGYGNIPDSAERGASQTGQFSYNVPHEGTIWVGNDSSRFLVVRHNVRRGDRVEVDPRSNRVKLNGEPIYQQDMEANSRHTVYYREAGAGSGGGPSPYAGVPSTAENMASGSGRVSWRAESTGQVWVGNDKKRSLVVDSRVNSGDLVEVDPKGNRVKVNGREVFKQNMESRDSHTIFFMPDGHKSRH